MKSASRRGLISGLHGHKMQQYARRNTMPTSPAGPCVSGRACSTRTSTSRRRATALTSRSASRSRCLAAASTARQPHFAVSIVEEAVRNACPRGESHAVTRLEPVQMSIKPDIGRAFDNIDEFFLRALRMRERRAPPRSQTLTMDTEAGKAEVSTEGRPDAHQLRVAAIASVVRLLDLGPMSDEGRMAVRRHGDPPLCRPQYWRRPRQPPVDPSIFVEASNSD